VAVLYGQVKADMAITGGVHTAEDVIKSMMAGAKVAMMTSALLRRGIGYVESVRAKLVEWMTAHEYESIAEMQGSMSRRSVTDPETFERANYMRVLSSYTVRTAAR
jgi:dihydroorotate dehydrogenase (fumarate)